MNIHLPLLSLVTVLGTHAGALQSKGTLHPALRAKQMIEAKAEISGVDAKGAYAELPPVLVDLSNLPRGAAVWVEVQQPGAGRSVTVSSEFFTRQKGAGVLNVPGLHQVCTSAGPWTMKVLMSDAQSTTTLASTTFVVQERAPVVVECACPCEK